MSWFDATGLANIAKSALKGAQKTIDKALDIRDENDDDFGEKENCQEKTSQNALNSDFFASWGLSDKKRPTNETQEVSNLVKNNEISSNVTQSTSWGSFSGSFFKVESSQTSDKQSGLIFTQPQSFKLSLASEKNRLAPLASPENELTPVEGNIMCENENADSKAVKSTPKIINEGLKLESKDSENVTFIQNTETSNSNVELDEVQVLSTNNKKTVEDPLNLIADEKVIKRQKVRKNSNRNSIISNRLSVISTESEGKKSCDSVEVLGSLSSNTSPDVDLPSISTESSSMGLPVSSSGAESVEVIDTLGSPSSIEVIDSNCSGRNTQLSNINSPADDPCGNHYPKELIMISSPKNSLTDISPESVEILPDLNEFEEELSVAESYTSASESTGATVLDPAFQYSYRKTGSFTDVSTSSSKFRSGESTPDILSKMPLTNKSSEILCESIHEIYNFDITNTGQLVTEEPKKFFQDSEQLKTSCSGDIIDSSKPRNKSAHVSPIKKVSSKLEEKITISRVEEEKLVESDLSNFDAIKRQDVREAVEENVVSSSDRIDSTILDEICGSSSGYSDNNTLVANDSSREGTIMDSSAEIETRADNQECADNSDRNEVKIQQVRSSNNSFYVKNLLAEAMGEDSMTRETSPTLSEKSRSDLVKVGSEQTSEHTSGDELETTTSSDIEIISRYSPNGDSSSTASRHSPAKLLHNNSRGKLSLVAVDILGKATHARVKDLTKLSSEKNIPGHQREPSEASSFCSEDNSAEIEKLSKRVTELTEILADRESKLIDLGKSNLEMKEKNQELKQIMEQAKLDAETKLSSSLTDGEKDELIKQLREEGDKLSKKELKQANLIKNLRVQEKLQQNAIEKNKTEIQNLMQELERVRAKLVAKEDLEAKQADIINQLTNKINRQDKEIANLLNEMEKAVVKAEQLKMSLEKAELELNDYKGKLSNCEAELHQARTTVEEKSEKLEILGSNQLKIEMELECLKQQLKRNEEIITEKENCYREEKSNLMRRLQEAEGRNEELTQSVTHATKPLLRQMEALQATIAHERETWEKQERNLLQKLDETEMSLSSSQYHEKIFKQEVLELRVKVTNLESQLQGTCKDKTNIREQVRLLETELEAAKSSYENEKKNSEKLKEKMQTDINELRNEVASLERQLTMERTAGEVERKKVSALQEQLKDREVQQGNRGDLNSPRSSPTLSFGRASLSESLSSNWPQFSEDALETFSTSGRYSNVYENLRMGSATSLIDVLQSQLKMREGEVSQLQWELQRRETERSALTNELSSLTTKVEELENSLRNVDEMDKNLKELQNNYDTLLEMYGEKVEEADELRLDLADVKDMYKTQIDQLLKTENQHLPT